MKEYILFLQYCLDDSKSLPESANAIDWIQMMAWAEQQAIVGVVYGGIKRAGKVLDIPFDALMEWIGYAQQLEVQNRLLYKRCGNLDINLKGRDITWCLLKGQGNALLYPNSFLRTSGDIDALVFADRKSTVSGIRKMWPHVHENYIHVDYPLFDDAIVEVHFWPSYSNNPILNRRIRKWFKEQGESFIVYKDLPDGNGMVPVPSYSFNVVYQLMHIMHHYFDEGIGLRQMVDYFYLLRSGGGKTEELVRMLKWLNLYNLAGAVMYVMKETLGLEDRYLIVPIDENRGKTLLKEILTGGNFGRSSGLTDHHIAIKHFLKIKRTLSLAKDYPAEALCEPVFRTWHFFWRLAHR